MNILSIVTWPEAARDIGVAVAIAIGYAAYRLTGGEKQNWEKK